MLSWHGVGRLDSRLFGSRGRSLRNFRFQSSILRAICLSSACAAGLPRHSNCSRCCRRCSDGKITQFRTLFHHDCHHGRHCAPHVIFHSNNGSVLDSYEPRLMQRFLFNTGCVEWGRQARLPSDPHKRQRMALRAIARWPRAQRIYLGFSRRFTCCL